MEPARGKSCLSGQRRGPATPGDKRVSYSDQNPFHISTTPSTRERKRRSPWSIPLRRLCEPQPNFLVADRRRLMEPARGKSCLSGQCRGPATPGDKRVSSSDQNPFHISTTPSTRKRKRRSPWSIPLRRLCKPQPNFLVADRRRLMEPGRGESCLSRQRRGPATPGVDRVLSPD